MWSLFFWFLGMYVAEIINVFLKSFAPKEKPPEGGFINT
jgi:hypothetical protein